ncbi:peptide ABC transporter substrate-binding protein [Anaerosphaera multitolerans]|nr:peptide ABC transporter substrate-binding protein [Anaerosphaera multitolerans]
MKKNSAVLTVLILILTLILTSCGGIKRKPTTDSADGKILYTNVKLEPITLDPALSTNASEIWILDHVFEGLMKFNNKGEIVPGMASKLEVSEDKCTYLFTLRDAKWSNGDAVTAYDFEYAWKRILDSDLESPYTYQLYYLENVEDYNKGKADIEDIGVKALNDKTLEVKLKVPTSYFNELMAFCSFYPVHRETVEKNSDWAENPTDSSYICNGPFKIINWETNSKIQIAKNEEYYGASNINLAEIDFNLIKDEEREWEKYNEGELDFIINPLSLAIEEMLDSKDSQLVMGSDLGVYCYGFNCERAPFDNEKLRESLSLSIDRNKIVKEVLKGGQSSAGGIVPEGFFDDEGRDFRKSNGKLTVKDLNRAGELLEDGLKEAKMTREDLKEFTLIYYGGELQEAIAEAIGEMWRENLGIEMNFENLSFEDFKNRLSEGDYEIAAFNWTGDYSDPMTMLEIFESGNYFNKFGYENLDYDELISTAKDTDNEKERMDAMKEAEKLIMEELPVMPIYFNSYSYIQKPSVNGVYKAATKYPNLTKVELIEK